MHRSWFSSLTAAAVTAAGLMTLGSQAVAAPTPPTTPTLSSAECAALTAHEEPAVARTTVKTAVIVPDDGTLPEHCRVTGTVENKAGGLATFAVSLPTSGYDGRMYFRGCGGSCGALIGPDPTWLKRGHVVATTDMVTHSFGSLSFAWARNNREAEIDFAHRATHEATVVTKGLVKAAYGTRPTQSYFYGGSTGGRQALVAAQRYPHDYDGIIALYPASNETAIGTLHLLWSAGANIGPDGQQILVNEDMEVLHAAAMKYCDPRDGLVDGLIEDPRTCDFKASMSPLTPAKAAAAQLIYDGPRDSSGTALTPGGPEVGSELNWRNNYIQGPTATESVYTTFGRSFTRDAAFETDLPEDWTPDQFDWDSDPAELGFMEQLYTSTNTDMTAFKKAGGKLLLFQGWADQSVVPAFTIDYFDRLVKHMGRDDVDEFVRFYTVPGLGHSALPLDATPVLHAWAEEGIAPFDVTAENLTNATKAATRPLYPYPLVPRWNGKGDVDDLASWGPFDPTAKPEPKPTTKAPARVRHLKVTGAPKARVRTVRWSAPARDGGAKITGYTVVIKQNGKVVSKRQVRPADRRTTVNTRALRRGSATVVVRAVNRTGAGTPARVSFEIRR